MYKIKVTKKEMRNNYNILGVGYCSMQSLLVYYAPVAYSVGLYGWACDYYNINDVIISTGYNPLNNKNMKTDYSLIREYEKKAKDKDEQTKKSLLFELLEKLKINGV